MFHGSPVTTTRHALRLRTEATTSRYGELSLTYAISRSGQPKRSCPSVRELRGRADTPSTIKTNTYLLHGAESFLRNQPVNFAASQEIPRIYGTRRFLTVPTSVRHLSLS